VQGGVAAPSGRRRGIPAEQAVNPEQHVHPSFTPGLGKALSYTIDANDALIEAFPTAAPTRFCFCWRRDEYAQRQVVGVC
jgi:hypothetical protein